MAISYGINRIRLEFKVAQILLHTVHKLSINRIRLEFKEEVDDLSRFQSHGINRIRLEFKVPLQKQLHLLNFVLIESDWNLKDKRVWRKVCIPGY